jgi:hypothetical protein
MDSDLRLQLLRAAARDRQFLKSAARDLKATDFPDVEEQVIAEASLKFYETHEEPVGVLLRSEVDEIVLERRLGPETRKKLKVILDTIQGNKLDLVSVKALENRVKKLRRASFYSTAVDEILTANEKNKLSPALLEEIVAKANTELRDNSIVFRDPFGEGQLDKRIQRRLAWEEDHKFPLLFIHELDEKIKMIGRGHIGLFLAPYASGKGFALLHVAIAYAMQGLKVLHISLEDPKEEVEDRFDSNLTGLPKNRLSKLPNKLRKRFKRAAKVLKGNVRFIDGTEGGWTVSRIQRAWELAKLEGFEADAIVVDYDDEIECEKQFKGESARRMEFSEIYKALRRLAAKLNVILWTAAQGNKESEGKKVVTGKFAAEDISKIRKVFVAIGIGTDPESAFVKHLFVARHRLDRSRFGVDIVTNFGESLFYDRKASFEYNRNKSKKT